MIHADFAKGCIITEVVYSSELLEYGSMAGVCAHIRGHIDGKDLCHGGYDAVKVCITRDVIDALRHTCHSGWVIISFEDRDTELVWLREPARRIDPRIHKTANRKLHQLDAAVSLNSLRVPPGNHLEALKGDRKGQHSIRINDQWRICFVWTDAGPENVIIEDYH